MPLYEYECPQCQTRFEAILHAAEKEEPECPDCGEPARRLLSGFAVRGEAVAAKARRCYTGG